MLIYVDVIVLVHLDALMSCTMTPGVCSVTVNVRNLKPANEVQATMSGLSNSVHFLQAVSELHESLLRKNAKKNPQSDVHLTDEMEKENCSRKRVHEDSGVKKDGGNSDGKRKKVV